MSVQNSEFFFNSAGGFYPYEIDGSLRFNDDDSAYLNRTPASAGNRKTWTWSGWVKRGNLGSFQVLFSAGATDAVSPYETLFRFMDTDKFQLVINGNSGTGGSATTTAVFRDPSSWYHIVCYVDMSATGQSNKVRIYVNGILQQVTYINLGTTDDTEVNNTIIHRIGVKSFSLSSYFDGYMAEINFIDGQALDPSSFGETKSGVWVPKKYAGTYGTNGFYLKFDGNANDSSGEGNNWTANNITANDYMADSPTSNFCTMNPNASVSFDTGIDYQEGNLRTYHNGATQNGGIGTFRIPKTGKWYFEFSMDSASTSGFTMAGVISETTYASLTNPSTQRRGVYRTNGQRYNLEDNVAQSPNYSTYTTGDVIGVAVDNDNGYLYFAKNNVWQNSTNPSTGTPDANMDHVPVDCYPVFYNDNNSSVKDYRFNFGQDSTFSGLKTTGSANAADANGIGDFYYTPPSGFLALCTANLPEPAISPANDESPSDYFNTVLYTGDGVQDRTVTGVGFQPDWVWVKNRGAVGQHVLFDAVRGGTKQLFSSLPNAEQTNTDITNGFASDGFIVGDNVTGTGSTNQNTNTYVAWNWKAGGTGVSNTAGSITSTVSANQDAGFSIVGYTGNGASTATVGHGLTVSPSMVIIKNRDSEAAFWPVYHEAIASSYVSLNSTTGAQAGQWMSVDTDTINFSTLSSWTNTSTNDYIAYCFAEIEGYSKFGKYTGNGSPDGPFVYTGFRPKFWMSKRTDSTSSWIIVDGERNTYNVVDDYVVANTALDENSATVVDFLSNGVKFRGTTHNDSVTATFIYMAFAENPFKYANAR